MPAVCAQALVDDDSAENIPAVAQDQRLGEVDWGHNLVTRLGEPVEREKDVVRGVGKRSSPGSTHMILAGGAGVRVVAFQNLVRKRTANALVQRPPRHREVNHAHVLSLSGWRGVPAERACCLERDLAHKQ